MRFDMAKSASGVPAHTLRGLQFNQAPLLWLYLLVAVPLLTGLAETGSWPSTPQAWIADILLGAVIAVLVHQVRKAHCDLLALTRTDALTGLSNRRAFDEAIQTEVVRARRSCQPLSLVYMDLDNFKQVNDRAGHEAGDAVLQQLAKAMAEVRRANVDRAFRVGGDEFALLLPGSNAGQAESVFARVKACCAHADPARVTAPLEISAGIVELEGQESARDFVGRADETMFRVKLARGVLTLGALLRAHPSAGSSSP